MRVLVSTLHLQVTEFLDESTLGLLFGMMILVGKLKDTGLFEVLCAATLKASRGKMWLLSVLMMYITGTRQQQ
jgi:Na+/H+ antiporter NhaD/arsenite permease-like protein